MKMKMLAASILIILTLSTGLALPPAPYDTCSCTADDRSCSTSVTCPGGCMAFCGDRANCNVVCLKDEEDESASVINSARAVTLRFKGSSSREVSAELARITGAEVVFSPTMPDATFDLEVENLPLWNLLEILSKSGRIRIGKYDFAGLRRARLALLNGERISLCITGATVKGFASQMRLLTGFDIRVTSGNPKTVFSYTARNVNFNEILAQVSERTGVQVGIK